MMCDSPESSHSNVLASLPEAESMYNQKYSPRHTRNRHEPHPHDDFLDGMMESDEGDANMKLTSSSRSGDLSPVLEHEKEQSLALPSGSFHSSMRATTTAKDVAPTYDTRVSPALKSILRNKYSNTKASQSQPPLDGNLSDFFASEPHNFHNHNSNNTIPENSVSSMPTMVSMEDEAWNSSLNSFQSAGSGTSVVFDECVHVKEFTPIERQRTKTKMWYTRTEYSKMERKAALKMLKHSKRGGDLDASQHSESSCHSASGKAFFTHPAMTIDGDDDDDEKSHRRNGKRFMKKMMRRISM